MQYFSLGIYKPHLRPNEETLAGELMQFIQTGNMKPFSYVIDSTSVMPFKIIILSRTTPVISEYSENDQKLRRKYGIKLDPVVIVPRGKCKNCNS